ncbi:U3 small nucleolar ribonucleoprotein lcp5-like protein [Apiospora rasikravindrae]|uniref:U3 small nucleolar ribonucleoprotein lcp5-like protein n=1 Tax=Apiospora rasikravindrae TaxID=990691 RepID=A0ABR1TWC6_9PEZI
MAALTSLPALLDTLTQSLTSAYEATPKLLLLSYLQNLVFLILLKIRNAKNSDNEEDDSDLSNTVVEKLVELRLYLEKGVRPLEEKLEYQLDRMLRAADETERQSQNAAHSAAAREAEESDEDESEEEEGGATANGGGVPVLDKNASSALPSFGFQASKNPAGMAAAAAASDADRTGVYRPPKISATVMPTTERREARERSRPQRSATMNEYINEEVLDQPLAQPSVGTTIVSGGRGMKTTHQKADEDRRRDYEETNFVRLPAESKKDRAKRNKAEGRTGGMQFGGEDWRDLGNVDRIDKLTRKKPSGASGTKALLENSRKRGREVTDGDRNSGFSSNTREILGGGYQKRVKTMDGQRGGGKRGKR